MLVCHRSLLGSGVGARVGLECRRSYRRVHSRLIWLLLPVSGVVVAKALKLPCQCTARTATTICLFMVIATRRRISHEYTLFTGGGTCQASPRRQPSECLSLHLCMRLSYTTSMGIVSSSSTLVADRGRLCRGFLDANVFCRTTTSR